MTVELGVNESPYVVRRSKRARRLQAVVRGGRVEVVVPRWARERHVESFLREAGPWIRDQAESLRQRVGSVVPLSCVDGAPVRYHGRTLALRVLPASGQRAPVERSGELIVRLPVEQLGDEARVRRALVHGLREAARAAALRHLETYVPRLGARPRGLRIKGQATVWGSCGRSGLINLNWRLIGAPPRVLEYIVVHELCHLRQRNHGPRFWRLVESLMPGYGRHRDWLRDHGELLG
jgi:predicted metal-dependent hydrolase